MAKTAKEKAQEALGVVERKLERAKAKQAEAEKSYKAHSAEVKELSEERDYLASHPALKQETEPKAPSEPEPSEGAAADKASVTSTPDLGF